MFLFAQLKSSLKSNFFERSISEHSKLIFIKDNIKEMKSYMLKKLLNKRVCRRDKRELMKYLMR